MALYQSIINIHREAELQKQPISETVWDFQNTVKSTGPAAFTHWVLHLVSERINCTYPEVWQRLWNSPSTQTLGGVAFLPLSSEWEGGPTKPDAFFHHIGQVRALITDRDRCLC